MTDNYTHEELAGRVASIHQRSRQLAHKRHQSGLQDHGMLGLSTSLKKNSRNTWTNTRDFMSANHELTVPRLPDPRRGSYGIFNPRK